MVIHLDVHINSMDLRILHYPIEMRLSHSKIALFVILSLYFSIFCALIVVAKIFKSTYLRFFHKFSKIKILREKLKIITNLWIWYYVWIRKKKSWKINRFCCFKVFVKNVDCELLKSATPRNCKFFPANAVDAEQKMKKRETIDEKHHPIVRYEYGE